MSEISLRAYIEYIEDRLSRDAHSEVIAQCRHILEKHPRYVEAYRLLARALLEQEQFQDALDLFQRVLSADPNDFVAHIGMSECYRESGALDQAIWHLERAFEQVPSNVDLQEEVKRLYVERDGRAPRKIQLTAGALARLYSKGKLYPQAILELRKALAHDPERFDLQTLLAEALWHNHEEVEAGKLAAQILRRLPNSRDANRILAQLWLRANQPKEAEPFLARLRELDPYLAYEVEHRGQPAPADAFSMTMLDYAASRQAGGVGAADWVSQIRSIDKVSGVTGPLGPGAQQPSPEPESAGTVDVPDWLEQAIDVSRSDAAPDAAPVTASAIDIDRLFAKPPPPPASEAGGEPGWLKDALAEPSPPPGEPAGEPGLPSTPAGEIPDWLEGVLAGSGGPPSPVEPPAPMPGPPGDDVPDWLRDVMVEPAAPAPPAAAPAEAPDWLSEVTAEPPPAPPTDVPAPAGEEREAPAWLGAILSGESDAPEVEEAPGEGERPPAPEVVSEEWLDQIIGGAPPPSPEPALPAPAADDLPDWLREVDAASPEAAPPADLAELGDLEPWDAGPPPAPTDDAGIPDWLKEAASGEIGAEPPAEAGSIAEPRSEKLDQEAVPGWLGLEPEQPAESIPTLREEEQVAPPIDEPTGDQDAEEVPDWLAQGDLDSDDAIAWLEELAAKYDPNFQGTTSAESAAPEPAESKEEPEKAAAEEELPDWLRAETEEPAPAPVSEAEEEEEELPDWLRGEPAPREPAAPRVFGRSEEELPDWLRAEPEKPAAAEPVSEAAAGDDEGLPDWLRGEPSAAGEQIDWLREPAEQPAEAAPAGEAPGALAWLDEQVSEQGVSPGEVVSEALAADQPPVPPPPPAPDMEAEAEPVSEEELPEWLKEAGAQAEIARALESPEEELEPELGELAEAKAEEDELAWLESALEAEEAAAGGELAAIFAEEGEPARAEVEEAGAEEAEEELPEWLRGEPVTSLPASPGAESPPLPAGEEESRPIRLAGPQEEAPPITLPGPAAEVEAAEEAEEEELPEWLRGVEEVAPAPDARLPFEPAPSAVPEAEEEEAEAEAEAVAEAEEPDVTPAEAVAEAAEEVEEKLPEWLREPAAPPVEEAEAVEEAPAAAPPPPPAPVVPAAPAAPAAPEPAPQAEVAGDYHEQLRIAREKLAARDLDAALPYYESLVSSGQMLEESVSDFSYALQTERKVNPRVRRVWGDALRAQGKLQEALEIYREALDEL